MIRSMTFQEIFLLWKEEKKQYVKEATYAAYLLIVSNHLLPVFSKNTIIEEYEIQRFVMSRLESGLSVNSIKSILIVLKMILTYGDKNDLIKYKKFHIIFPTDHKDDSIEVFTRTNQKKLMTYVKNNFSFKNLGLLICLTTGLRIGELCALTWNDINLDKKVLSITKTIERIYLTEGVIKKTKLIIDSPKTKTSIREIPLTDEMLRIVRPLLKVVNKGFYILTNSGKPTEPRTYRNYYLSIMKRLELPFLKFHSLRHSFATRCIESKGDYKTVSVLLGHADIGTTLNLYVHPNAEQKKKCIESMLKNL